MPLEQNKMEWLLAELAKTDCPMTCPHGQAGSSAILNEGHSEGVQENLEAQLSAVSSQLISDIASVTWPELMGE